jgi:hypothetical protein
MRKHDKVECNSHYREGDFKATFSGALLEINLIFEFKNKNLPLKGM